MHSYSARIISFADISTAVPLLCMGTWGNDVLQLSHLQTSYSVPDTSGSCVIFTCGLLSVDGSTHFKII